MSPTVEGARTAETMLRLLDGTEDAFQGVMTAWRGYLVIRIGQLQVRGMSHDQAIARMAEVSEVVLARMTKANRELSAIMRDRLGGMPVDAMTAQ